MEWQQNLIQSASRFRPDHKLMSGVVLMGAATIAGLFFFTATSDVVDSYPYLFLLPWLVGLAIVLAIPLAILYYQGKFNFYNPIVFATLSYFFPAFVLGGISLASGLSNPYFLSFIQDPKYNLPLTVALTALGFSGLFLGYSLPIGKKIGAVIERRLPKYDYRPPSFLLPAGALLFLGIFNTLAAFGFGLLG